MLNLFGVATLNVWAGCQVVALLYDLGEGELSGKVQQSLCHCLSEPISRGVPAPVNYVRYGALSSALSTLRKLCCGQILQWQAVHRMLPLHIESAAGVVRALLQHLCMTAEKRGEQLNDDLADLLSATLVSLRIA